MDNATPKLSFPTVLEVKLHSFSLYKLKPNLSFELPRGVFCLAGANGLGKTSFLATLNYGLTGIIPNLGINKPFRTSVEYYQDNYRDREFTKKFFEGRIDNKDRDDAAISVIMQAGNLAFTIKRHLFNYEGLSYLQVTNLDSGEIEYEGDEDELEENETVYKRLVCTAIGLIGFEQFVFLQHFVLTFDESRRLLLWDSSALNEALYLCIGADYNNARKASELTRAMEKSGSRARNAQFQASNVRTRIETIRKEFAKTVGQEEETNDESTPEEVEANHRALVKEVDKLHRRVLEKQRALRDCDLQWIARSSKLSALQAEFEREFTRRIETRSQIHFHPTISATLSENRCAICHSPRVAQAVQNEIDSSQCPLCSSALPPQQPDEEARLNLSRLDAAVAEARDQLRDALQTKERLTNELKASEDSEQGGIAQLQAFEAAHTRTLREISAANQPDDVTATLNRLEAEFAELQRQKDRHYTERDEKRKQLTVLQKDLKRAYVAAEEDFVPLVQELASAFLGIDLQVAMEARTALSDFGLGLVLSVRNTARREGTQLSESQRFFLDIALRMALVQYISDPAWKGELLIDTPEGSLDIAYEARAGSMFAQFVRSGHNLFMTANINSSQLLLELAKECSARLMTLKRMTSWTELSEVQQESEHLFNMAYSAVEAEL